MNRKLYIEYINLFFLGIVTSLSLPPFNYLIINFFTLSFFFLFLIKKTLIHNNKKTFFLYGWIFGLGYFISNLYWISISLTFDKSFKFLIPIAIFLIPSFLAIFYGLVSYFFIILKPKKFLSSFLMFSLIFGVLEFLRGTILTGFPWNLISYSFSKHLEILSITSIIGTYGFNLVCISLFTSPAIFFLGNKKKNIWVFAFFVFLPIFFYIYGFSYKEKFNLADKNLYDYKLRAIGSNISLDRFYTNIDPVSVIEDLIKISDPKKNEKTIFIWPEGILPGISQDEFTNYSSLFRKKFNNNHLLMIGINSQSTKNSSKIFFNSFSLYDHELTLLNSYNKINLVPFGEFLPFENILKNTGFRTITNNYQSFSKGEKRDLIHIKKENFSIKILPLICYEIIYSGKLFDSPDFDLIVNISEDGWFGQSIGPKQHFSHSIFRAIESGKYVVRSANNGLAAIINPLGVTEQKVNFGDSGYVDFNEIRKIQPTVFSKYGNKIFGLLILLYIFLIFSFNRINNE
ncbi:apolipoprotein N-acyltransferase [Pelagibacterales bacterium SAG-MED01]|nr:apolipoprotein N-acyltransferase [Pelagibacterales bacterium SAG-MED01]